MRTFAAFLLTAGWGLAAQAREFPGLSAGGPSGMVLVPTGQVLKGNWWAAGLHRGVPEFAYGAFGVLEGGITFPDILNQPTLTDVVVGTRWFAKAALAHPDGWWWAPGVGAGAENSVGQHLVDGVIGFLQPKAPYAKAVPTETYYYTGTWDWNVATWPVEATAGAGTGRFQNHPFGGLGIIPRSLFGNTLKVVGELAGRQAAGGVRLALSRNLRLDLAMLMDTFQSGEEPGARWTMRIHGGMLGVSQTNPLDLSFLHRKKKKEPEPAHP